MKKVLALFMSIILISCTSFTSEAPTDLSGIVYITGKHGTSKINIYTYTFNGHKYQYHHHDNGYCSSGGPVHDPDCICLKTPIK